LGSAKGLRRAGLTRARKNMVEERGSQLQNKIIPHSPVFFPRRYLVLTVYRTPGADSNDVLQSAKFKKK
jgi:hypothetical protein